MAGAEGLEPSARGFGAHCELYSHYMGRKESGDSESKNVDQMTTAETNKACFGWLKLFQTIRRGFAKIDLTNSMSYIKIKMYKNMS